VRLHLWDWSKSDLSRVMLIQRSELGVLSPDGRKMLSPEGEVMNLESRETRQFSGFSVKDGQRMSAVRLSPTNKHVAAMIHAGTRMEKDPGNPALSGAIHSWSLRLLELDAATHVGKRIGEFPAQAAAGVVFSSDNTSVIYSSDKHSIIRRDLSGGKVLNEYQPAIGTHGAVGIAISPDGRFVSAGQYHGKIYVWETESGKLLVEQQLVRDNGEADTFFQAKVLRFSPDGERLAMASGSRLKVMETKTGKIIKQHYHETTPAFTHLQWSPDAKQITLVTYSEPADFGGDDRIPSRPTADKYPRVYEWDWQTGAPGLKTFP
jgi:WD40 repeat protein